MKKLKKPLTRSEMKRVTGGLYPCDFGGYVCPFTPSCDAPGTIETFVCIHNSCILTRCA
jgi:hypothetical protein